MSTTYDTIQVRWKSPRDRRREAEEGGLQWNEHSSDARLSLCETSVQFYVQHFVSEHELEHSPSPQEIKREVEHIVKRALLRGIYKPIYEKTGDLLKMRQDLEISIDRTMAMPRIDDIFRPLSDILDIVHGRKR